MFESTTQSWVGRGAAATLEFVARIPGRHFLRNLVERRALVAQLVSRDFRTRYVGSSAGWLWGVVHPIVQLLIWIVVFQYFFGVTLEADEVTTNYPLFLFCGILPWWLFQETVTRSAASLVEQSNLITRTVFPSEVVPVSIFLSSMIHHLIAVLLAILTVGVWLKTFSPTIVLLPVYMLFLGLFAVGVGWLFAVGGQNLAYQLPAMAVAAAVAGYVLGPPGPLLLNCALILVPLLLSILFKKRLWFAASAPAGF